MNEIKIKSVSGDVLFTYECENNTIKKTVEQAVKMGVNLQDVDLSGADLRSANLQDADLSGADLSGANLTEAYLSESNLQDADLSGTDLSGANLSGTDLLETDLSNTDLSTTIISMYSLWSVDHIGSDRIKIGCKVKTVEEWDAWFAGDETFTTNRGTEEFKRIYAHYVGVREYLKIINAA